MRFAGEPAAKVAGTSSDSRVGNDFRIFFSEEVLAGRDMCANGWRLFFHRITLSSEAFASGPDRERYTFGRGLYEHFDDAQLMFCGEQNAVYVLVYLFHYPRGPEPN